MESADLKAARARVNSETNDLASTLQPIADKLSAAAEALAGSMTPDEQASAAADLGASATAIQGTIDALKAMGATEQPA